MSFEEAAAIPIAAITALQGLRDHGHIAAGQKVLINGASGGVGTYAVQIAKSFGAEVTGVCSTRNVELVRSLGADHVIDYTQGEFHRRHGALRPHPRQRRQSRASSLWTDVMKPAGHHRRRRRLEERSVARADHESHRAKAASSTSSTRRLVFFIANVNKADLELLAGLVRDGKLKTVIDRRYPLEEAGAALEYLGSGHARGKVVVTVN